MHVIGQRVTLQQFDPLLLAEFPDDPSDAPAQLTIDHTTSVLWDENNVILATPEMVGF